jgi:hypothetical protein
MRRFIDRIGTVVSYDNVSCGATDADPWHIVYFGRGKGRKNGRREAFWAEELQLAE